MTLYKPGARRELRVLATALAALAFATPFAASAAGAKSDAQAADDNDRVRSLFREGAAAFQAGKQEEARQLLLEAWAIRQTYDVASSLAQVELELKLYAAAAQHLDFCIRNFAPVESEQTLQQVRKAFADVKMRVGAVNVSTDRSGAEVFVDSLGVGTSPLPALQFVEPGPHKLGARLGAASTQQALNVEAGKEYTVQLKLGDEAPKPMPGIAPASSGIEAPPPTSDVATSHAPDYAPAIIVGSVGAAALVTSVVLVLEAAHKDSERDDQLAQLSGSNRCGALSPYVAECNRISSLDSDARTFRTLSFVGFGATAAAGVATYLLWPRTPERAQLGFRAMVLPSTSGLDVFTGLNGSF
jgi:hypothetical protein